MCWSPSRITEAPLLRPFPGEHGVVSCRLPVGLSFACSERGSGPFSSSQSTAWDIVSEQLQDCQLQTLWVLPFGPEPQEKRRVLPPLLRGPTAITQARARIYNATGSCKATVFTQGQEGKHSTFQLLETHLPTGAARTKPSQGLASLLPQGSEVGRLSRCPRGLLELHHQILPWYTELQSSEKGQPLATRGPLFSLAVSQCTCISSKK